MIILLAIFQYGIQAVVDLMDKFLISTRKIEPVSYTFYTVVMGLLLLALWPWNFAVLPAKFIFLDILSGVLFSLAMYVFFVCLAEGEVSRVVPFVFGLVPVFDILIGSLTGHNMLTATELAAMGLLIPGALLVSHQEGKFWPVHLGLKTVSALLFSTYYALWQFAAHIGPILNNLMWNRLGAAAVLLVLLIMPAFRKKVFGLRQVEDKKSTSFLFIFKQILGGANFIFLSFLFVLGKISIINGLQGFRYIFVLLFSWLVTRHRSQIIKEETTAPILTQKSFGIVLVFIGTILLFIK